MDDRIRRNRERRIEQLGPDAARRIGAQHQVFEYLVQIGLQMQTRGLRNVDLARRMNVDRSQVGRWLKGEGGIRAETLFMLADALDLRAEVKLTAYPQPDEREQDARGGDLVLLRLPLVQSQDGGSRPQDSDYVVSERSVLSEVSTLAAVAA